MRIIFAGTPPFAAAALEALADAGHEIALVLTQPDRPAGRGMKLQASPVKQCALEHGIRVEQPMSLRLDGKYPQDAAAARQALLDAKADGKYGGTGTTNLTTTEITTPAMTTFKNARSGVIGGVRADIEAA